MNSIAADPQIAPPQSSPIELEVRRIRELAKRGRHAEALSAAETLAVQVPENRDVLLLIALCQRHGNRIAQALATLERLEQLHPRFSRLYQERGHCYVALRDAPRAIDAFLRGVNINPALPASWSMLEGLYRMTGQTENAGMAAAHVATLKGLPPEVVRATSLFSDGELLPAENIVRAYLLRHGDHVEAMRLLARIGMARDVLDDAELLLEAVLALAPDYRAARHDYALVLVERHKYLPAREQLEKLLQLEPGESDIAWWVERSIHMFFPHISQIIFVSPLTEASSNAAAAELVRNGDRDVIVVSPNPIALARPKSGRPDAREWRIALRLAQIERAIDMDLLRSANALVVDWTTPASLEEVMEVHKRASAREKEDIRRKLSILALTDRSPDVKEKASEMVEELKSQS